jgi:hypothetical protein
MANRRNRPRESTDCIYARATIEDHIKSKVTRLILENPVTLLTCYPNEFRGMMQQLLAAGNSVLLLKINPLTVQCQLPSRSRRTPMGGKRLFVFAQRGASQAFMEEVHRRFHQDVVQASRHI